MVSTLADRVLTNAQVLTMDSRDTRAEAVAIRAGRIVAIGTNSECLEHASAESEILDLRGATVIPGLVDPHLHLAMDAVNEEAVELRDLYDDVGSVAEILRRLRVHAEHGETGDWIIGLGSPMQADRLEERRLPTKDELDSAVPDKPCYLTFGAHLVVANSEALRRRAITEDTADPPGGTIERYPGTKKPNGVLHERARLLMQRAAGDYDYAYHRRAMLSELNKCVRRGVTSIHDILRYRREVALYQDLRSTGELPCRVHMIHRVVETEFEGGSLTDAGLLPGFGDQFLRLGGVKLSIDGGVTGHHGAFSPRSDDCCWEYESVIRIEQDELDAVVSRHHEAGVRCCVHAVGDTAVDMALAAFGKAQDASPRDLRHRIEHMGNWLCSPERLSLARRVGVTPVPNPTFLHYLGEEILESLGPKRLVNAFPFRTLIDYGFPLVFGSDGPGYWPSNPLRDIGTAASQVSRRGLEFSPHQRISVLEGLRAQTLNAAWLGLVEQDLGSLEPGKLADMAVLEDNPLTFQPGELADLGVLATIIDGEVAFAAESLA
jgi:predicted amidohydrolase YtcJ